MIAGPAGLLGEAMACLGAVAGAVLAAGGAGTSARRVASGAGMRGPGWRERIVGRIHRRVSARRTAELREGCAEVCGALAAELWAGRSPREALERADRTAIPEVRRLLVAPLAAGRAGADVAAELAAAGESDGAEALGALAACWRVGAAAGGRFAEVIDRLTTMLRDEQAHRDEVAAQLAGPRASARLLAGLPVLGIALAAGVGVHPLAFLLGRPLGIVCLLAGVALDVVGLYWTSRLAAAAVRY